MSATSRPRPRFSEDWLVSVLDSLSEGVIALDAEGQVTAANPAAEEVLGFRIAEHRYRSWRTLGLADLRHEGDRPVAPHPIERALAEGRPTAGMPVQPGPRSGRWLELAAHILDPVAGAGSGVVVTFRDITARIEAQRDRERTLGVLRDVLAMSSHDLRGPIFTIGGYAQLLADAHPDGDEDLRNGLEAIRRQVEHLSRLVADLSITARLETGGVVPETEAVAVADVVADALQTAAVHDVRWEVDPDLHAQVDPDHVRRILVNLLENARKYAVPPIELTASAVPEGIEVTVSDHGTGVPVELVPVLFDRFTRAAGNAAEGTGLGLAIVASLAELNGGSVRYERADTGGARFLVRLPAVPAAGSGT